MIDDERFMDAALAIGRRGLGRTAPNPSVGAIVVKDGIIVGRGWTAAGGRPHAETIALAQAGEATRGGTLYVTLEPCSHHGRTPPCCEAVVAAGIARLVYAIDDPNDRVAGQGVAYCQAQGLAVTGGINAAAATRDHRGHISMVTRRRPAVTLKLAETADGFVAGGPHDPRLAITGIAANGVVHVMRAMHEAIMAGVGTILSDDPLMTVRLPGLDARPIRIVLDSQAHTPLRSRVMQTAADAPVLLLVGEDAPAERTEALSEVANVEVVKVATTSDGRLNLPAMLGLLGTRGLTRIFSEGGPTIAAALIAADLVDDVAIFTAPRPLGGGGVAIFDGATRDALADPGRFRRIGVATIGADRLTTYESVA